MLDKPILKPSFNWELVEPEGVLIISERDSLVLNGRLYQLLMPLMNGENTVDRIIASLPAISTSEVYYGLMLLEKRGYIVESSEILPLDLTIFCQHLNIAPQEASNQLKNKKVGIKNLGVNLHVSELIDTLQSLQVQVSEAAEIDTDIDIILTDNYLNPALEEYNRKALERSRPWLLVKPVGTVLWIGPLFIPDKTGCWQCLSQRLQNNRPFEKLIKNKQDSTPLLRPLASLASTQQTALGIAATEVFKWIVKGDNPRLEGKIILQDTLALEMQTHLLIKRPQCPSCGDRGDRLNREPMPIILGHRKKIFTADGGYRCCSPEETLRKYQHHISPITGIVRELRSIYKNANSLTHCYLATHHFATMFDDLKMNVQQNLGRRSAGKGKTDQQAKVSALCEAIERYSGVFQGDEFRKQASYQQLGDRAIHPNTCMNFSPKQYETRQEWNAGCDNWFQRVPEPFDEEQAIEWTPVWSLTREQYQYLPTAYCYHGYPRPEKPSCWADSNGCAAGNNLEEAILQGFLELVERDCVAVWWYNRLQKPRVDLESFDDPYFPALQEYYHSLHRELWVLDLTHDFQIPCFAAITKRSDRDVEDITLGFGAHFDPQIAISRALTEVNQILPNVLAANADGTTYYPPSSSSLALKWWQNATVENQPYLAGDRTITAKTRGDYPQRWSDDLLEDVMLCKKIAEQNGMEMLVADLTRPDIGLRVAKAIVPGMRHWWKRWALGRLYDVPVKMGWLTEPLSEEELNPFPMWM